MGRRTKFQRRLAGFTAAAFGGIVLVAALAGLLLGDTILDGPAKRLMERAYRRSHPGSALRIGSLAYSPDGNRLFAHSVTLQCPNSVVEIEELTLTGLGWVHLLRIPASPEDLLAGADLDATRIAVTFDRSRYGIACERLRVTVRDSLLLAEGFELRTLAGDDDYFAARPFRKTRYLLTMPEFRVLGLQYDDMIRGRSYRARSARLVRPDFDAYVNRDKPSNPQHGRRLMVHEKLAAMRQPLQVDSIAVEAGTLSYRERVLAGDAPGVLTFNDIALTVQGLANRSADGDTVRLAARCALMDAGLLKFRMSMPVAVDEFSLRYAGSLGAMDATCLNAYLEESVRTRLKSCDVKKVTFDIHVDDGRATGRMTASYRHLEIAQLDTQSGHAGGFKNSIVSFLANVFKIRSDNTPDDSGRMKAGKVEYARETNDNFYHYVWRTLKSGIVDIVCY